MVGFLPRVYTQKWGLSFIYIYNIHICIYKARPIIWHKNRNKNYFGICGVALLRWSPTHIYCGGTPIASQRPEQNGVLPLVMKSVFVWPGRGRRSAARNFKDVVYLYTNTYTNIDCYVYIYGIAYIVYT